MKSVLYKLATQTGVMVVMLLMVFAPFASLTAQAQFDAGNAQVNPVTTGNGVQTASGAGAGVTNSTAAPSPNDLFGGCSISGFSASGCISAVIYAFTIGIASVFAYVAAYFFDITIQLSLNGASYGLDFVSTSWTTARDLGNMAFLFILLYIAFTIMLKADTGQTKTMLAIVITVALLVNFSFFFTRVVIDAGNILAIQFYNAIPAPPISQTIQGSNTVAAAVTSVSQTVGGAAGGTKDLTAGIMNMLNVQGLLNNNSFTATNGNFIAKILIYLAGAIVLWLLTIAFVTSGIKFLTRVVVLWFLIIVSPLALISIAVQGGTGGYFSKWRSMLVQHSFYPVVFMFVFLVLNNFATTMASSNTLTGGVFTNLTTTSASSFGAIGAALVALAIRLALVIAVLYIGMQASDKFSIVGASFAGKAGGWFGDKLKSTMFMPARLAGIGVRETLGRQAYNDMNNLKKNPSTNWAGRLMDRTYTKAVLAPLAGSKFGTANSFKDVSKARKDEKTEVNNAMRDEENKKMVASATAKIKDNIKANKPAGDDVDKNAKDRIQNLGKREFEAMSADEVKAIAPLLKDNQIKMLEGMDKFNESQKDDFKSAHHSEAISNINRKISGAKASIAAGTAISDADKKKAQSLNKQEMEKMTPIELKELAVVMSEDQKKKVDELDISDKDKEGIRNEWEEKGQESPYQKSIKKLREVSLGNREVARELSALAATDIIDGNFAQKVKNITDRENNLAKELHKKASKEYIAKQAALDAAHAAHAAAPTPVTLAARNAAQAAHDTAELAEGIAHSNLQKTQALVNKQKEFEENLKKVEANTNINSGTKGVFKSSLI